MQKDELGKHLSSNHSSLLQMVGLSHIISLTFPGMLFQDFFSYTMKRRASHTKKQTKAKEPNILPKACEGDANVGSLEPMKASGNESGCELTGNLKRGCGTVLLGPISREKKKLFLLQGF